MRVLGIETSCDETAASVVTSDRKILSNVVLSQLAEHAPYLGVVPEIAARSHAEHLDRVIAEAMREAKLAFSDLDAIAATCGPGLIGGVIVGAMMGKAIASAHKKPFVAINHLEGHALSARLMEEVAFPFLLLLVSGGHCQLLIVKGVGHYEKLGSTLDDALGEAFDKTAKLLGLGYPGGPAVEAFARRGDAKRFKFAVPLKGREGCDFSFSGLKTAVRQAALEHVRTEQDKADICASFQRVVVETLTERLERAITIYKSEAPSGGALVVAGGVAANAYIREALQRVAVGAGLLLHVPPPNLCTDNAAMIAWAGIENLLQNNTSALDFEPRARWPLSA